MNRLEPLGKAPSSFPGDAGSDSFVSISHAFRTPLSSIKAYVDLLLDFPEGDRQTRQKFFGIVRQETDRLTRLVDELLELCSRDGNVEPGGAACRIDIGPLIKEADEPVRSLLLANRLKCEVDVRHGLPRFAGDRQGLMHLLTNLLANAIQYTPPGDRISLTAEPWNDSGHAGRTESIHLCVHDNGIGIPPEELPRVFERFFRGTAARTRRIGGTGLGLAICREIMRAHRGTI